MILKTLASAYSPGGPGARLTILIFHRVLAQQDPLFPDEQDVRRFTDVLTWVGRWFQVLPLDEAVVMLGKGNLPARAAAITFDDGYADNATNALPVLQHHGMAATFFVATSFLDGGRMWNDTIIESVRACRSHTLDLSDAGLGVFALDSLAQRRAAIDSLLGHVKYLEPAERRNAVAFVHQRACEQLPDDLMMTSEQVRQLHRAGMQIGAHTRTHPILASVSDAEALDEIGRSKADLERILQDSVTLFAYPNGKPGKDYLEKHARMVKAAGFAAAVSTAHGVSTMATDPFQLPRFSPWDKGRLRYGARMISNLRRVDAAVA